MLCDLVGDVACAAGQPAFVCRAGTDARRAGGFDVCADDLLLPLAVLAQIIEICEDVVRTAWGQFCFFWDPEGNPLQFYESAFVRPDADPERTTG